MQSRFTLTALILQCFLMLLAFSPVNAAPIRIAVAANLQYVFNDLQAAFNQSKKTGAGIELQPVFASSGKLTTQILQGAPFDVLLSADMDYPTQLHEKGFALAPPKVYALGTLVLWTRKDLNLAQWPQTLASAAVEKIALPNPKVAPYGRAAMQVLAQHQLEQVLTPKLVYGESIGQTSQYIQGGLVDIGFTAKSVVLAKAMQGQGKWVDVPPGSYTAIAQGAVLLKHSQTGEAAAAQHFYDFLFSATARSILRSHGYLLP